MDKVLNNVVMSLRNKQLVIDLDIDNWNEDNIEFNEIYNYLNENGVGCKYNEKYDRYEYYLKSEEE